MSQPVAPPPPQNTVILDPASIEKICEAQIKQLSASFDKSVSYTNLLIIAGYGSFFALWSITKPSPLTKSYIVSALLILISISIFVFHEVFKMTAMTQRLLSEKTLIQGTLDEMKIAYTAHELKIAKINVSQIRTWIGAMLITVPTALIAIGILISQFVCQILAT